MYLIILATNCLTLITHISKKTEEKATKQKRGAVKCGVKCNKTIKERGEREIWLCLLIYNRLNDIDELMWIEIKFKGVKVD